MNRVVVVTGAASGIGAATVSHLRERGVRVITADLRDADVIANLATAEGRRALIAGVASRCSGAADAVIANAGGGPVETSVQLNYFGAVATLDGLRPLLARSAAPRAVAVSSIGSLFASRMDLVDACLGGSEAKAIGVARDVADEAERAGRDASQVRETVYGNAKLALNRWCRSAASSPDWAGAGIPLNVVALGLYDTPAAAFILNDPARSRPLQDLTPLRGAFPGRPQDAAALLAWLVSAENTQLTGQVMFADGGFECRLRGGPAQPAPSMVSGATVRQAAGAR
ncbi:MAG TPA: SDR family oxidoreductase [Vicinamibacteria bacterium]|nr:SDR family oxidoreductase [Vicinamibacteria bacterium]